MKHTLVLFASLLVATSWTFGFTRPARTQWVMVHSGIQGSSFATIGSNLFAGIGDSVFVSTNNGADWTPINTGLTHCAVRGLAAIGPNLFAGLYDFQTTGKGGVFLSTNNGTTWTKTSLKNVDVNNMAASGTALWIITGDNRVLFSANSGSTWKASSTGLTSSNLSAIASDGVNVFVGTIDAGVFLSTNGGTSWKQSNAGLTNTTIYSLAASGTNVYAGTFIGDNAVYVSANSGTQWTGAGLTAYIGTALAVTGPNLFVATADGVDQGSIQLTTNNGTNWKEVNSGLSSAYINAISIGGSNLFVVSNDGVWRRPLSEMITVNAVAPTPSAHGTITAYPNPLTQSTTISFTSPESGAARITVVNMLGKVVSRIFDGELPPTVDGERHFTWDARGFARGIYWCEVRMNRTAERTAMVLTR